KYL
ncbi:Ribonuclease G, partial [Haemophilus influenzae]